MKCFYVQLRNTTNIYLQKMNYVPTLSFFFKTEDYNRFTWLGCFCTFSIYCGSINCCACVFLYCSSLIFIKCFSNPFWGIGGFNNNAFCSETGNSSTGKIGWREN